MIGNNFRMDQRAAVVGVMLVVLCSLVETRTIGDSLIYKNKKAPTDWKMDKRYSFKWEGDFTYGVPEDSKCEKIFVPNYGRVVCSSAKGLSRIMCLSECMEGYEHAKRAMVFICQNDGKWINVKKEIIPTPHPECVKSQWASH